MTPAAAVLRTALTGVLAALVLVITSCATSSEAEGKVVVAGPREAVSLIESTEYVVLDLRSAKAFEAGHVAGARSLPFEAGGDFTGELVDLDKDVSYLLYAHDPQVSHQAADVMVSLGFERVVDAGVFGLLALAGARLK